jgi:excisionase family DNA binding protein
MNGHTESEFMTIDQLSQHLNIKKSTLYSKAKSGGLPYYKVGRLLRFKKEEADWWMENNRREPIDLDLKAKEIFKKRNWSPIDISSLVKNAIDVVTGKGYTPNHGRPDRLKGLRKEVEHVIY